MRKIIFISGLILTAAASTAQATPKTGAEATHCLAIGNDYLKLADVMQQAQDMLEQLGGDQISDEDKATLAEGRKMIGDYRQKGGQLSELYKDAVPPSQAETDKVENTSQNELDVDAAACLP